MFRLLKVLSFALALAALSIVVASCGSNGSSQIRFVHAIQDAPTLDIYANGTLLFSDISFLGVLPNQPGYSSVISGTNTIQGFLTGGETTQVFSNSAGFGSGTQYTLVATGFSKTGLNGSNVILLSVTDNNTAPPSGDVSFRVIHASPSGPSPVDVYIQLNPSPGPLQPPAISGLAYTQGSRYVSISFNPNNDPTPPGYTVYVTTSGSTIPIFSEAIYPNTAGAIRTLVLTDVQSGSAMQQSFLELSDAN
jgi:hypothetical protein